MRAVNLLPKDANKSAKSISREDPAVVVGSALGAVVMIALIGGFLNVHSKVNSRQAQLDSVREEYAQVSLNRVEHKPFKPVKQKTIVPVPSITSDEAPRLSAVSSALGTRIAWDRILREFSLVLPNDVRVSGVTMSAPDPTQTTTGAAGTAPATGFAITGTAYSHDGVARLLSRLMLIPDLENVTLGSSNADDAGGDVQFSISASVRGAVAPPPPAPAPAPAPAETTTSEGSTS